MAFTPPYNNVVVQLTTRYIGNYSNIIKAAELNPGSRINPADLVQIVGEVVAVPCLVENERLGYEGFSVKDIRVGDRAFFRFDVVFAFDESPDGDATHRNLVSYIDGEYWLVDITKLFAVIREGEVIMQNGYVMVRDMSKKAMIVLPEHLTRITSAAHAIVANTGHPLKGEKPIDIKEGDKVFYNHNRLQEYKIGEESFGVLRQQDILGKEDSCKIQTKH
jgi:co-chaperonin GroES (HSP10)